MKAGGTSGESPLRFLALGDSYTIGEAVRPDESWPFQFVRYAKSHDIGIHHPVIIAQTGWTTDELLQGIREANPTGVYQLISLLIGVNNLYRERSSLEFRSEFRLLLDMALRFGDPEGRTVVVLSIPDWGATPFAEGKDRAHISNVTDEFNAVCKEEAAGHNVSFVDVTPLSRRGLDERSLVTTDGLHPSAAMYSLWVEEVFSTVFSDRKK